MSISLLTLHDFVSVFAGNTNAYGVNETLDDVGEDGKRQSNNYTKTAPLTDALYQAHLRGDKGLGVIPIRSDNTCVFSVIDVDVYGEDHKRVLSVIKKTGLPLIPFRSKSGGLHLYVFWETPIKAKDAIELMKAMRRVLMLDKKTEIFPKQTYIKADNVGNWINLPYFDADHTQRYLMDEDGRAMALDEALFYIRDRMQTKQNLEQLLTNLPLFDAPPCLQAIYIAGDVNNRNLYLFSLARYYKTKMGDDFEFAIVEANNLLARPIPIEELQKTVIATHKKKEYSYKCKDEPICSLCEKEECKKRKYGIGGDEISELSFGEFIQYASDPPYYEWIVNEKPLKFWKEEEIIMQNTFRNLCFRCLHILPQRLNDHAWTNIINSALQNVVVKSVEQELDISSGALFLDYIAEFLTSRAMAVTREQVLADRVFKDMEKMAYVFKPKQLLIFLIQQKQFRYYGLSEIQDRLKTLGATPTRYYVDADNRSVRVWFFPFEAIDKFIDANASEIEVDFTPDKPQNKETDDEQF